MKTKEKNQILEGMNNQGYSTLEVLTRLYRLKPLCYDDGSHVSWRSSIGRAVVL